MKKAYVPFAAAVVALVLTVPALADAPNLLNYQGRLTDPSGNPKNGTFTMQFAVYDAETGGNQLPSASPWSETQNVTVTNGVFNVLLGSATPLSANLFEGGPSDVSGPLRFLQVTVSGEELSPRRRIVSAAYAIRSRAFGACVIVHNSTNRVSCGSDEMLVAGGCWTGGRATLSDSYPDGLDSWFCSGSGSPVAYAKCCK